MNTGRMKLGASASQFFVIGVIAGLCGCASSGGPEAQNSEGLGRAGSIDAGEINPDPWEPMNRGLFAINEGFDKYLLGPVARGWKFVTPAFVRQGLTNFYDTVNIPVVVANDVLTLRGERVVQDVGRLAVNIVFGLGGLFDAASAWGIPENDGDFGLTLAYYGAPPGPYVMIPLLGPSTVRDAIGVAAEIPLNPYSYYLPFWGNIIVRVPYFINLRAQFDEEISQAQRDSFDYYVFVRSAYLQNRRFKVEAMLGVPGAQAEEEEDLYYFDEDDPDAEIQEP